MGRTIAELQRDMSSAEFSVWQALYEEDRLGGDREEFLFGSVCATIVNFAGKSLAKGSSVTAADFMPSLSKPSEVIVEPDPVAFFTAVANTQPYIK